MPPELSLHDSVAGWSELPLPLTSIERAQAEQVARRLNEELRGLISLVPEGHRGASAMSRVLELDRATCQRIVATAGGSIRERDSGRDEGARSLVQLPGVQGLRQFVAADPSDIESRRALAKAEQAIGQSDHAVRLMEDCLVDDSENPRVWEDWLTLLHERGALDRLAKALEKAPPPVRERAVYWNLQGLLHERATRLEDAARAYRKAVELMPNNAEFLYRLSIVETRLGKAAEAQALRARFKAINDARDQLEEAYNTYSDAVLDGKTRTPEADNALRAIAAACRGMGWLREAEAWTQVRLIEAPVEAGGSGSAGTDGGPLPAGSSTGVTPER